MALKCIATSTLKPDVTRHWSQSAIQIPASLCTPCWLYWFSYIHSCFLVSLCRTWLFPWQTVHVPLWPSSGDPLMPFCRMMCLLILNPMLVHIAILIPYFIKSTLWLSHPLVFFFMFSGQPDPYLFIFISILQWSLNLYSKGYSVTLKCYCSQPQTCAFPSFFHRVDWSVVLSSWCRLSHGTY